jgi:hypothetical protein
LLAEAVPERGSSGLERAKARRNPDEVRLNSLAVVKEAARKQKELKAMQVES